MLSGEATNTNSVVFGLTPLGIERTTYHTRGDHANLYTTEMSRLNWLQNNKNQTLVKLYNFITTQLQKSIFYASDQKSVFYQPIKYLSLFFYFVVVCLFIFVTSITKFVSSNPVCGEVYSIQHYVIRFVSDLRQVSGFIRILRFPPPIKLTATI